jgi:hypothetical protein
MTMQTSVADRPDHRLHRRETVGANAEINFESLAPVLMMSFIGLTLSLLIVTFVE